MIKLAICDDDIVTVKKLDSLVSKYSNEKKIYFSIEKYTSGVKLLESSTEFDLAFLDVDMPELDGIDTGKRIKQRNIKTQIIFITNYPNCVFRATKVRFFGYVVKPLSYEVISSELDDFMKISSEVLSRRLRLNGKSGVAVFNANDVFYFEVVGKNRIKVNSRRGIEEVFCSLNDVFELVENWGFAIPHQSVIVNMMYIDRVLGNEIVMKNGEVLPIAQKRKTEFRERHMQFFQKQML